MNKRRAGLLAFGLFTIVAIIHLLSGEGWVSFSGNILMTIRWIFIASLVLFAIYKKSLTTWILVAMAIGVEIGVDFPKGSQDLKFLSTIFLRLVKTIVAPLLFATLVVVRSGRGSREVPTSRSLADPFNDDRFDAAVRRQ